jgi:hypothetical protein
VQAVQLCIVDRRAGGIVRAVNENQFGIGIAQVRQGRPANPSARKLTAPSLK